MHTYIQIWNHFFANQRPALSKLQPQHLHCRHPRPRAQFDKSKTRSGGRPKVCRLLVGTFQIGPWAGGVGLRAKKPKFQVSVVFQKKNWAALRAPPRDRVSDSHVQKFSVRENQCHDNRRWTGVFFGWRILSILLTQNKHCQSKSTLMIKSPSPIQPVFLVHTLTFFMRTI